MRKYPAPAAQITPKAAEPQRERIIEIEGLNSVAEALRISAQLGAESAARMNVAIADLAKDRAADIHVKIIRDGRNMMSELVISRVSR